MAKSSTSFKKGQSGNPKGRPKSSEADELRKALDYAKKKKKNISFLEDYCEKAYEDSPRAIALLRKIVPDKIQADILGVIAVKLPKGIKADDV